MNSRCHDCRVSALPGRGEREVLCVGRVRRGRGSRQEPMGRRWPADRTGPATGVGAMEGGQGVPQGFEVVMVRNWCSTPQVTFLQERASPSIAMKVWIWATADVLVPVTTIVPRA